MKFVSFGGEEYQPTRWLAFNDVLLRPQHSRFASRNSVEISTSTSLGSIVGKPQYMNCPTEELRVDPHPSLSLGIPVISANMDTVTGKDMAIAMDDLGGLGILHRFYKERSEYVNEIESVAKKCNKVAFSIGCGDEWVSFVESIMSRFWETSVHLIVCLDVAHAHATHAIETIRKIANMEPQFPRLAIIAGNIATGNAAYDLAEAGAHCVKVGIGCGSLCTTRLVTGSGVPQLSAIMDVRDTLDSYGYDNVGIIADGGIRHSGDIVKSLAVGADAVMIGQLFAGTEESPGEYTTDLRNNSKTKVYRGQSSKNFMEDVGKKGVAAEGIHLEIPYKGSMKNIVSELVGGIRSGMTYSGAGSIQELRKNAEFQEISEQGWIESMPHATLTVK